MCLTWHLDLTASKCPVEFSAGLFFVTTAQISRIGICKSIEVM